jgi:hypothetical protein
MVTAPTSRDPGVSHPLSPYGPPQPIEHARGDALSLLSDEAKALVIGRMLDRIQGYKAAGGNEITARCMRTLVAVAINGLYEYETRLAQSVVDFDPTTR